MLLVKLLMQLDIEFTLDTIIHCLSNDRTSYDFKEGDLLTKFGILVLSLDGIDPK